ncbi:MAG: NTP transferase domain-containing protein, partial [Oscillospiraceae bacterium]|nr:NTP transferase domain-containing protein [Oscillospiraceae bacterium]
MKLKLLSAITRKIIAPKCSAVIVAAGTASRMEGVDKIVADVSGKPMILRTAEAFEQHGSV